MCGILFVDLAASGVDVAALRASGALSSLSHRGPEAYAELVVGDDSRNRPMLLSFHRLAVVHCDDSGMQPFVTDDGKVAMVCSGEIYNYRDISVDAAVMRSDVDVVLHLLQRIRTMTPQDVATAVARLDGDFAFVVADGRSVVAGRDPFGVRPLFYAADASSAGECGGGGALAFASEAKALVRAKFVDIRVFPPGFVYVDGEFVQYVASSSPSLLRVEKESSRPLSVKDLLPTSGRFGDVARPERHASPSDQASLLALLTAAVEKRIRHSEQHDVAVLCSGGIDSAALTCIAAALALTTHRITAFTMRYASGHSDDAFYAGQLCGQLGIIHEVLEFSKDDLGDDTISEVVRACETCDPNTVRAAIPMYLIARRIRERVPGVKVVLSGEGADELFGGYGYFRLAPYASDASLECDRLLRNIHQFDLLRADRCFAAHGLEVRVPFLDAALVEFVRGLPADVRVAGEKQLLRDAVSGFLPLVRCRVLDRPKEKFSDGAGFSYVPDLLRRISSSDDDGTLPSRLKAEAELYRRAFVGAYGTPAGRWVIDRTMPSWTDEARRDSQGGVYTVDQ